VIVLSELAFEGVKACAPKNNSNRKITSRRLLSIIFFFVARL
jgi:hypothetical protein